MTLKLTRLKSFTKDQEKSKKRGKDLKKLQDVVSFLIEESPLPPKNRNHKLKGNCVGCWECHIEPDWLLIYQKTESEIRLIAMGSHSDLF